MKRLTNIPGTPPLNNYIQNLIPSKFFPEKVYDFESQSEGINDRSLAFNVPNFLDKRRCQLSRLPAVLVCNQVNSEGAERGNCRLGVGGLSKFQHSRF